jgi:hypothetical protein
MSDDYYGTASHEQNLLATIREQEAEIERLHAIVDKLPKTADGVPTLPSNSTRLWYVHPYSGEVYERTYEVDLDDARSHRSHVRDERTEVTWISVRECYSTLEAAEKAK